MLKREYIVNLDLSVRNVVPTIQATEGEEGSVELNVTLENFGTPVDLTGVELRYDATDSHNAIYTTDGFNVTDAPNGRFTFTYPKLFFENYGEYNVSYFTFTSTDDSGQTTQVIKSFRVPYIVHPATTSKAGKNYLKGS